jgi:hypothetical protein
LSREREGWLGIYNPLPPHVRGSHLIQKRTIRVGPALERSVRADEKA